MKFLVQLLLFSIISFDTLSQNLNFRHYTTTDGLAGMSTFMSMQDSKGYIWFATTEGVSRFDGTTFTTYNNSDGLSDNSVLRIYEDHLQRIWFLTYNGHLSYFSLKDENIHNEKTDPFLKNLFTGSGYDNMFVDSRKRIWFGSINCTVAVLDGESVFLPLLPKIIFTINMMVYEDENKQIYLSSGKYKMQYSESDSLVSLADTNQTTPTTRYFGTEVGRNCFLTKENICATINGKIEALAPADLPGVSADAILTVNYVANTILIATKNQGLIVIADLDAQPSVNHYPVSGSITSATIDLENNIWLSTQFDGVYMLSSQYRKGQYFPLENFENENLLSICQVSKDVFLTGTYDGTLFLWRNGKLTKLKICPECPTGTGMIRTIQTDSKGFVWIFGEAGLFYGSIASIISHPESPSNFRLLNNLKFNNLSETSDNKIVTVTAQGLYFINKEGNSFTISPDSIVTKSLRRIYSVCASMNGSIYYASIDGLFQYSAGKTTKIQIDNEILNTRIKYLEETKDTVLIVTTAGNGVLFFKNEKLINHLTHENGLASSLCGKITLKENQVFICTNKGLSYFTYSNNTISDINTYSGNNGLLPGEVLEAELSGKLIYVVTSTGLSIVPLKIEKQVVKEPSFYITGIYNYKDEVINSSIIEIPDKNNILKVKYTAIAFTRNEEVLFQYKFDNNNWNTTHLTELIFPDLPPGSHTLLLRAKKADSNWSKIESIHIYVQYPFYLSWWFISGMTLLMIIGSILLYIYLNRRRNRQLMLMMEKRATLNNERNRISADMHDDVGSDLSKISITSEFAKTRLAKEDDMYKQLEKISGFAYGARKKMDDIIWALNPENDTLGNLIAYVNKFGLEYFGDTNIRFQVINQITENLDHVLNSKERRNIFLIVKELCTNVFKHSGATSFTITFHSNGNNIIMETKDDGKGFIENDKSAVGNGLQNIRKRVGEIQGTMIIPDNNGDGTQYHFFFNKNNSI